MPKGLSGAYDPDLRLTLRTQAIHSERSPTSPLEAYSELSFVWTCR